MDPRKVFDRKGMLVKPIHNDAAIPLEDNTENRGRPKKNKECPYCEKRISELSSFDAHVRRHQELLHEKGPSSGIPLEWLESVNEKN